MRRLRSLLLAAALAPLAIAPARAEVFPDSVTQVGPWRVQAYTRGQNPNFDGCSIIRTQSEGFTLYLRLTAGGSRHVSAEAPTWGLTPKEHYPASFTIGPGTFTFNGTAANARFMSFEAAPEFFTALKTAPQLGVSANQRFFTIGLDGIDAAMVRQAECVKQYGGRTLPALLTMQPPAPSTAPSASRDGLAVLVRPTPVYPPSSRLAGEEGEVMLEATIDINGLPSVIVLRRSSGYPALDNAAIDAAKGARFRPYIVNGKLQPFTIRIPFSFKLHSEPTPQPR